MFNIYVVITKVFGTQKYVYVLHKTMFCVLYAKVVDEKGYEPKYSYYMSNCFLN
jgi:hypothetical protein